MQKHDRTNPKYRWVILGVVSLVVACSGIVFQSIPPVLSLIIEDLQLSHAEAGLLMSVFSLVGVFVSIPVGLLADRYPVKNLIVFCLGCMVAGTLVTSFGGSFSVLILGRLIAGAGAMSVTVLGVQLISHWFAGREVGFSSGAYSAAWPVGTIVSSGTLGGVAAAAGWHASLLSAAAASAIALLVFVVLYRPAPVPEQAPGPRDRSSLLSTTIKVTPFLWLVGIAWMMFTASTISFLTFGPDFFVAKGYGLQMAGLLAGFLMLLAPPVSPLVGFLLDRYGRIELAIAVGGLMITFGIFSLATTDASPFLWLTILSIGNAIVPAAVFAFPPRVLKPLHLGIGYGVLSTCSNLGSVVGPFLAGLARDATGSYQVSFYLMAVFALLIAVAGVFSALRGRFGAQPGTTPFSPIGNGPLG